MSNPIQDFVDVQVRQAYDLADKAITGWAAQVGMTREEWLKHWHPQITFEPDAEDTTKTICRVRPVALEDCAVTPDGWMYAPDGAPTGKYPVPEGTT